MPPTISDEERRRLLAEVRALAGAPLQKLWLPSAQVCVLQLRVPGRSVLVVVDARLAMAAIGEERPTAPESAPRSQATLRAALEGARLTGARLEIAADRRTPAARLEFGPRALIADEALILVEDSRIIWASSGAGPARRPGTRYPEARELELGEVAPLAERGELVRAALRREEEAGLAARRREVVARLKSRAQKLRRTLDAVDEDAARAARAEEDLRKAELLLPQQGRIKRGSREARVQDWSRTDEQGKPAEAVIALDPALSAAENAARWLRKAKRYQAAGARISARRAEVAADLAAAEELLGRASSAQDAAQLAGVEAALPASPQRARRAASPRERLPYRKFRSQSGAPILVGRSARDNDALTFKVARGNDVWLHARGLQGAHVILPGAGEAPDSRALGDAALLAAHFSSSRGAAGAEVAWTRCKYVRKPRGAAPGSVTISQEKTMRVRLDEERLAALLRSEG